MFSFIWYTYLYQPLFNVLIWIYGNWAGQNLGWAVIYLTILLRVVMLPLSIVSERNAMKQEKFEEEVGIKLKSFKHDAIAQKEELKKVMKKYHISPWAKTVMLLVQVLVLVLLYQVFVRGITGEKIIKLLYPWMVDFPGKINTIFYGFEIGKIHDSLWSGITALYLFVSIFIENKNRKKWETNKVIYLVVFPLFTFGILWILPMVKSLFILTTMIFSDTLTLLRHILFPVKKPKK